MNDSATTTVKRALISVFDKAGLVELGQSLSAAGVEIISSGGTSKALGAAGVPHTTVGHFTGASAVLGGRVKTLHPRVHAGILADRRQPEHMSDLSTHDYVPVDLVVCNLYPFQEALAAGKGPDELIENIDIGGPTMVRAAAKNCAGGVTVVTDPSDYGAVLEALRQNAGAVPTALRLPLAAKAFRLIADYDLAISSWYDAHAASAVGEAPADGPFPEHIGDFCRGSSLRYGENPHQKAAVYTSARERRGAAHGVLLGGKALSYNNFLDMDAAYRAVWQLERPGCSIVKHTNPCGLAQGTAQTEAFERALAGDPVSAFGSVIGFNTTLEGSTAEALRASKLFVECIVAPDFDDDAREALQKRSNLRLVRVPEGDPAPAYHAHRIGGGLLVQEVDAGLTSTAEWQVVTKKQPEPGWLDELAFAMRAAATLKSNAIAVTRQCALLGAGAGHMSRVDATEQALKKAGERARGAFLGSDAFFPFDDCVKLASDAGIVGIVQPGGSKRDQDSIDACDALGLVMVFAGRRHFRH